MHQHEEPIDILVVSTDYDTRAIFATVLRSAGYAVRELDDPNGVVAAARDCAVVITDYPTPAGSGATVTELLRRDPRTRDVIILNATTHALSDEIGAADSAGVDATLVLPAFPDRVVSCVQLLLSGRERRNRVHTDGPLG